jgi:pimeloyl-ACP methyl ester carboxylesterase
MSDAGPGRMVDVREVRLHVVERGPAEGLPVVLLHGFPEFWYGWRRQLGPLAEAGFRVLVPDQRGYNRSEKPRAVRAYGLDRLARDSIGLLDAEGIDRASLVGHDWGGAVAWWAAMTRPERLRRVAVLNAPHPLVFRRWLRRDRDQRRRSWYWFLFQLPWLPELWYRRGRFSIGVRSLLAGSRARFDEGELDEYRRAWGRPGALRSMLQWYRAALRCPPAIPRERGPIPTPLLLLWGERDRYLETSMIEPSLAECADARVERLADAGHWLHHEQPRRVAESLIRFLS